MKPLWRWLGKQLCCFAFVSCWGVHSQKQIWNLKRKIFFPTPMLGFNLDFFFEGGLLIISYLRRMSAIHPPMMFWGYGRMADIWSFGCVVLEMGTASSPWGHPGSRNPWCPTETKFPRQQGRNTFPSRLVFPSSIHLKLPPLEFQHWVAASSHQGNLTIQWQRCS